MALAPRIALAAPSEPAPPPEAVAEARHHFLAGSKAYNIGEFPHAIEEYKAAYNALPDPSFLYNIAQAYRLSGNLAEALFFYRSYLRNVAGSGNRHEVETHIAQIEAQLAKQKAVVTAPVVTPPPKPVEPVVVVPPPEPSVIAATEPPPEHQPKPAYKKPWVWGVVVASVAVVAVGLSVGLTVGLEHPSAPSTDLGNQKVFSAAHQLTFTFGGTR